MIIRWEKRGNCWTNIGSKDANKTWEEAIKKTLKTIEELKEIRKQLQKTNSLDINTEKTLTEVRLLLDELLMFAEIKWYRSR